MDLNIRLTIDAPKGWKRRALLYVGLPIALVGATAAVAKAYDTTWIASGQQISASKLKADLDEAQARLAALEDAGPSAGGGRNYLLNGGMDFFQRGNPTTLPHNNFGADRWVFTDGASGAAGPFPQGIQLAPANVPNGLTDTAMRTSCFTGGAGGWRYTTQWLEPADASMLQGKTVTFSIWARAALGNQAAVVGIYYGTAVTRVTTDLLADSALEKSVPITGSTTWQRFAVTASIPSGTSIVGVFIGGEGGANSDVEWDIAQAMLNDGATPMPFQRAGGTLAGELSLCQRYFTKSYDISVSPGTAGGNTRGAIGYLPANGNSGGEQFRVTFPTTMRADPSVVFFSTVTGNPGCVANVSSHSDECGTGALAVGQRGFSGRTGNPSSSLYYLHYTADAEF